MFNNNEAVLEVFHDAVMERAELLHASPATVLQYKADAALLGATLMAKATGVTENELLAHCERESAEAFVVAVYAIGLADMLVERTR